MSSKACPKSKHPCKICHAEVGKQNGVQCQGACKAWVHFECLNYTKGKIHDIKKGNIVVTCPCPDCESSQPKEIRVNEGYTCTNAECPANKPPKCQNKTCPINKSHHKIINDKSWPITVPKCEKGKCQKFSTLKIRDGKAVPKNAVELADKETYCPQCGLAESPCETAPQRHLFAEPNKFSAHRMDPTACAIQEMCNTVGALSNQINQLISQMKQSNQPPPPRPGAKQKPQGVDECSCGNDKGNQNIKRHC